MTKYKEVKTKEQSFLLSVYTEKKMDEAKLDNLSADPAAGELADTFEDDVEGLDLDD